MHSPHAQSSERSSAQIVRVVSVTPSSLLVAALRGPAEPWQVASALPEGTQLVHGDQVVVLSSAHGPIAVARLRRDEAPETRETEHALSDGARVTLGTTQIVVERADGTPLFRYEAGAAHGKVTLASESLELGASAGDLSLTAAGAIRLQSRSLSACTGMPGHSSTLSLEPRRARLRADAVELSADAFKLDAHEAELSGDDLQSHFKRARLKVERLETIADSVVSRARNVYQNVQELLQQQAGSLRTLVAGTAQLKAREVAQRAEEAYKIRGEKIHIG
jgi:hypothetical protein